jgi:GntR family transcriptional regulator/MocR family aminotransferase
MDIFLDPESAKSLTGQLYEQLRRAITEGRLLPGDQLVPSRQLAGELSVSRHTVTTAYGRLVAEGYADGHAGGGSVVASAYPAPPMAAGARAPAGTRAPTGTGTRGPAGAGAGGAVEAGAEAALRPSPRFAGWSPYFRPPPYGCRFDLRPGLPDPSLFPAAMWRRRVAAAVAAEHREYGDPAGRIRLRRAIAGWVARSRSVAAGEDTVVVTSGTQHAVDLVARILLEPGDCVAIEDPGYVPVRRLFGALGAKVVGVPVDDQGLVVDLLPPSARIVYVTPSHQYPLGMTMSMPRRRALLRWAERHDAAIIEDDYDTEFRYVDRPLEPLQGLDTDGRVVYVGSFSKSFSPSIRLGFAVVPKPLAGPVAALRQLIDWHPPIAMQTALAGFIDDGLLDKHIRRNRRVYAERHHIVTEALSGSLAEHLTVHPAHAGLHIAAVLRRGLRENEVLQTAARHGIVVSGLSDCFHTNPAQSGLLIGFGAVNTSGLPTALRMLDRVLASQGPGRAS